MSGRSEHVVRVGSRYRPNDSQWAFEVRSMDSRYAYVSWLDGSHSRRILLADLRPSLAKHGYSLIELGPEVDA